MSRRAMGTIRRCRPLVKAMMGSSRSRAPPRSTARRDSIMAYRQNYTTTHVICLVWGISSPFCLYIFIAIAGSECSHALPLHFLLSCFSPSSLVSGSSRATSVFVSWSQLHFSPSRPFLPPIPIYHMLDLRHGKPMVPITITFILLSPDSSSSSSYRFSSPFPFSALLLVKVRNKTTVVSFFPHLRSPLSFPFFPLRRVSSSPFPFPSSPVVRTETHTYASRRRPD